MVKYSEKQIREMLREKLPQGAQVEIAEMAGVTPLTVNNFFRMKNDNIKVEYATLRYLSKMRKERIELYESASFGEIFSE